MLSNNVTERNFAHANINNQKIIMDSADEFYTLSFPEETEQAAFQRIRVPSFSKSIRCPSSMLSKHSHCLSTVQRSSCDEASTGLQSGPSVSRFSRMAAGLLPPKGPTAPRPVSTEPTAETREDDKVNAKLSQAAVQTIDMRNAHVSSFPPAAFNAGDLRFLRLDYNCIRIVPASIGLLTRLEVLSLSHNEITTLDRALCRLVQLRSLILDHNQLGEWPEWICTELTKLRVLHLHENPGITAVPVTFLRMTKIEQLGLDWFLYVPSAVGPVLSLKKGEESKMCFERLRLQCKRLARSNPPRKLCHFFAFFVAVALKNKLRLDQSLHIYPGGQSALHLACRYAHSAVVKELLEAGHTPNCLDAEKCSPLLAAIQSEAVECAQLIVSCPAVDVSFHSINSPLIAAINGGRYDLADVVVRHPTVDVMARDSEGNTALHCLFARFDCHPLLIERLCLVLINDPDCDVNERNSANLTPLHVAAMSKQILAIKFAARHNQNCGQNREFGPNRVFDFSAPGGESGATVLHDISLYTDVETLFSALRTNVDVLAKDLYGHSARDTTRDALAGKLLLRKEQRIIRNTVLRRPNNPERKRLDRTKSTYTSMGFVPVKKSSTRGKEDTAASHMRAYPSRPPKMFADVRRTTEGGAGRQSGFSFNGGLHSFLGQLRVSVAGAREDGLRLDTSIRGSDLDQHVEEPRLHAGPNEYSELFKQATDRDMPKYVRLKAAHRIFAGQKNPGSLLALCKGLENTDPVKSEVVYMLGVLGSFRRDKAGEQGATVGLNMELENAVSPVIRSTATLAKCQRPPAATRVSMGNSKFNKSSGDARAKKLSSIEVPLFKAKNANSYFSVAKKK